MVVALNASGRGLVAPSNQQEAIRARRPKKVEVRRAQNAWSQGESQGDMEGFAMPHRKGGILHQPHRDGRAHDF